MKCSNFSYLFFIQNEDFFGLFLEVFHTPSFILLLTIPHVRWRQAALSQGAQLP